MTKAFSLTVAPGQNGVGLANQGASRGSGSREGLPVVAMALGLTGAIAVGFGIWAARLRSRRVSRAAS